MKFQNILVLIALLSLVSLSFERVKQSKTHKKKEHKHVWDYLQQGDNWGGVCASGNRQSPINLPKNAPACPQQSSTAFSLSFLDQAITGKLTFTHHGIKLSFPNSKTAPATLVTGGADGEVKTYNLLQMHYHFKSEHLATDKQHSAEAHFVFSDGTNEGDFLAVLGVFLRKGNNKKAQILPGFSLDQGMDKEFTINLKKDFGALEKKAISKDMYAYKGSLTTPPCTEAVNWHVIKKPVVATSRFFRTMSKFYKGGVEVRPNYRNVQLASDVQRICSLSR